MSVGEVQQLRVLKQKFIAKVVEDFAGDYVPIQKNDFESVNLSALVSAILKKNKEKIPEHKLKEFLVSEQTLRRIFEERHKDTTFQQTTRNFLSLYIGYLNYEDFSARADFSIESKQEKLPWLTIGISVLSVVLLLTLVAIWKDKLLVKPLIGKLTNVVFESNKAPITIKFNYKFSHKNFERAYLDYTLAWKKDTIRLDKNRQSVSVCFMHPTVRTVKLIADGNVLDSTRVIIPSDGWVAGYNEIQYLPSNLWKRDGVAHLSKDDLPEIIQEQPTYYSFIKKVANFDKNLSCDAMVFEARLKNPVSEGGISCNDVSVVLTGTNQKFAANLTQKGCSHYAYVYLPNKNVEGQSHDLSKLGVNLDEFVIVKIVFKQKHLQLLIDNQLAFESDYSVNLGKLDAVYISFKGLGTVDYIKLSDSKRVVEHENF